MRRLSLGKIAILTLALLTLVHSDTAKLVQPTIFLVNKPQILLPENAIATSAQSIITTNGTITPFLGNQKGGSTTPEQIASFKKYIDLASTFYRFDVSARLNYISNKMNQTYGVNGEGFTVIVYHFTTSWFWHIRSYNGVWASIEKGFDPIFPQASYMFLRQPINSGRSHFSQNNRKGSGITLQLENVITNIIAKAQNNINECRCSGLPRQIFNYLFQYDGGYWNVFCSSYPSIEVLAYTRSNRYLFTNPGRCNYAIYDMKK